MINTTTAMDTSETLMQSYVTGALAENRPRLTYYVKCDDVPAEEIAIFTDILFLNFQSAPGMLAKVIRDVLKKCGKRYFLSTCYSQFLGHEMRYIIETGLAKPRTYALIDEKFRWEAKPEPGGMAVVFELS